MSHQTLMHPTLKAMRQTIRGWHLQLKSDKALADLSAMFAPILRGWQQYYGRFHGSALKSGVAEHEPVSDPVADAQAQEAGGPLTRAAEMLK
jgi:hypothetical protein